MIAFKKLILNILLELNKKDSKVARSATMIMVIGNIMFQVLANIHSFITFCLSQFVIICCIITSVGMTRGQGIIRVVVVVNNPQSFKCQYLNLSLLSVAEFVAHSIA